MKLLITGAAMLGLLLTTPARADDARTEAHDALEAQADAPKTPTTLPTQASDRAREVQSTIAHGKKGAAERAEHAKNGEAKTEAARSADDDAETEGANKSAKGVAASAAKSANSDSHAAAGQARAAEARGGTTPGSGKPAGTPRGH